MKDLALKRKDQISAVSHSRPLTRSMEFQQKSKQSKILVGKQSLNVSDLEMAEQSIIQYIQAKHFAKETFKETPGNLRKASPIYKLDPMIKDGILCVGRRLSKAALPEKVKHPAILPKHTHISTLILRHIHEKIGHAGRNLMLSELRKKFWIINANSSARKIITDCIVCRRNRAKIGQQKMADLPQERLVADLPPFSNVGVNYFGPIEIKRDELQ